MRTVSNSPRTVAAVALEVGRRSLPKYGYRFSRRDFTLAQLFALLADAGFDLAHNHQTLRAMDIESIIPAAIGRPTRKLPNDKWRYLMATEFDEENTMKAGLLKSGRSGSVTIGPIAEPTPIPRSPP